jgi:hypothetical protein
MVCICALEWLHLIQLLLKTFGLDIIILDGVQKYSRF